jgi:hypothetical protein
VCGLSCCWLGTAGSSALFLSLSLSLSQTHTHWHQGDQVLPVCSRSVDRPHLLPPSGNLTRYSVRYFNNVMRKTGELGQFGRWSCVRIQCVFPGHQLSFALYLVSTTRSAQ